MVQIMEVPTDKCFELNVYLARKADTLCFAERTPCPSAACHTLPHTVAPSRALGRNETRCGFLPHLAHCSTLIVYVCTVT